MHAFFIRSFLPGILMEVFPQPNVAFFFCIPEPIDFDRTMYNRHILFNGSWIL